MFSKVYYIIKAVKFQEQIPIFLMFASAETGCPQHADTLFVYMCIGLFKYLATKSILHVFTFVQINNKL